MSKADYNTLKARVWAANMEIPARGLALYTWGNVSGFDPELGIFAIKPSGVPYKDLREQDIVVLSLEGKILEGELRPSSDTPTHAALYRNFVAKGLQNSIQGIVHTHSPYACAWAQAGRGIPLYGTTHADHTTTDIPCTDFLPDTEVNENYELATGRQILDYLSFKGFDPIETQMILVAGHGPFTWGSSPEKAVYHAAVLEELAKIAWITEQLNPMAIRLKPSIVQRHFQRKHGPNAYYGQANKQQ